MRIKLDLLKAYIADYVVNRIHDFKIDENKIANTTAIKMISEIQDIITNEEYDDFEAIEAIVCVFEKYQIDAGTRHDFG